MKTKLNGKYLASIIGTDAKYGFRRDFVQSSGPWDVTGWGSARLVELGGSTKEYYVLSY